MAKTSKLLKTGNSKAQKPGKAERFVLTQEQADVAGQAGVDFAQAELHAEGALAALAEMLYPLSGRIDDVAPEMWNHYRSAFVFGYADAMGCAAESAGRAWTRAIAAINALRKAEGSPELVKPQTAKAAAKQAARKSAKPEAEDTDAGEDSPKDGAGEEAAAAVQMGLSRIEAHLIALVRAGKFEMAAECVAGMADATAQE